MLQGKHGNTMHAKSVGGKQAGVVNWPTPKLHLMTAGILTAIDLSEP